MPEPTKSSNLFRRMWDGGYRHLLPIVPPGAAISPNSSLARRPQALGKIPGMAGSDGLWFSFDWQAHETTEEDLDRWHIMGAGIGINAKDTPGVDIDVKDEQTSQDIRDISLRVCGQTAARIGLWPKMLLPYRSATPIKWRRLVFTLPGDDRQHAVEILGDGRQWVTVGIHPITTKPYRWDGKLPPHSELPELTEERADDLMGEIGRYLLGRGASIQMTLGTVAEDRSGKSQDALRAPCIEALREAIELIPNDEDTDRDTYINLGIAVKAALPDQPGEAEEIWTEWAMQWPGNEKNPAGNDLEIVASDWGRIHGPFGIGAQWVFDLAKPHGFNQAKWVFQPIDTSDYDPWAPPAPELPVITWVDPADYDGAAVPERKWVVEGWIPEGVVTAIYGDGGIGKTLLSQQLATCVSAGLPFLGLPTQQMKVMCVYCEDSADEIHIRQRSICDSYLLNPARLSENLRLASRDNADNLLCTFDGSGAISLTPLWKQLRDDAMTFGARLVIVDTAADTFGGDELKRTQVRQFIQACLGRIAKEIGGSVVLLAHPSAAGIQSGKGTGGSTAWNNSVRSRLYLQQADDDKPSDFRRLTKMKANYSKTGETFVLKWEQGVFVVRSGPAGAARPDGTAANGGGWESIDDMRERVFLEVFDDLAGKEINLSAAPTSAQYAPKLMKRMGGEAVAGLRMEDLEAAMDRLLARGVLSPNAITGTAANRKPRHGLGRPAPKGDTSSIFD